MLADLGAALRRNGSLTEARDVLARAADEARLIGARALLARATTELRAAGARPRRVALTGADALTPAELRVVRRGEPQVSGVWQDRARARFAGLYSWYEDCRIRA